MKKLFVSLLVASMVLWGDASRAEGPAGHVTRVQGSATALTMTLNEPTSRRLTTGRPVFAGDRLETLDDARLEVRLRDGTLITLGEKSVFVLQNLAGQGGENTLLELTKGVFRAATATGVEPAHLQVHTAVATIGIRGTELWGGFYFTPGALDVTVLKGKGVYVENAQGRVELVPGEGTTVMAIGAPSPAKTWKNEKLQKAIKSVAW